MKLLLDECLPRKLKFTLAQHGHESTLPWIRTSAISRTFVAENIALLIIRTLSNDISDIEVCIPNALKALKSIESGQIVEVGAD